MLKSTKEIISMNNGLIGERNKKIWINKNDLLNYINELKGDGFNPFVDSDYYMALNDIIDKFELNKGLIKDG